MSRKFDLIVETALKRYQGSNFLIGDRVKFIDNFNQHDWAKAQPGLKLERLSELIESGDNIRISAVKAERPATAESGHFADVDNFYVDVVREAAPGLFMATQVFTVPQDLVELIEDYPNLSGPTPKGQVREDDSQIDPVEVSVDDNELSPVKQTASNEDDRKLATQNTDISTEVPAKSYTGKYLES